MIYSFSPVFLTALKLTDLTYRQLSNISGLNPTFLSRVANGRVRPKRRDPRIVKVGEALGIIPSKIYLEETSGPKPGSQKPKGSFYVR